MYVTEAKTMAKKYLAELFDISIKDIRVDEVVFVEECDTWQITLSFSCRRGVPDVLVSSSTGDDRRLYKCIHICDCDDSVGSMFDRLLPPWTDDETIAELPAHA